MRIEGYPYRCGTKGSSVVLKQLVIGPFRTDFDLRDRPPVYKPAALPIELRRRRLRRLAPSPVRGPRESQTRLTKCLRDDPTNEAAPRGGDRHCQSASQADSDGCAQNRRASRSGAGNAERNQSKESAHHYRHGASPGRHQ